MLPQTAMWSCSPTTPTPQLDTLNHIHRLIGGFNQLHRMNSWNELNVQQLTTPGHNLFANPGYLRLQHLAGNNLSSVTTVARVHRA